MELEGFYGRENMEEEGRKRRLEDKDKIGNATFLKNHEVFPNNQ